MGGNPYVNKFLISPRKRGAEMAADMAQWEGNVSWEEGRGETDYSVLGFSADPRRPSFSSRRCGAEGENRWMPDEPL